MTGVKLEVPSLSQSNVPHDRYVERHEGDWRVVEPMASRDNVVVHAGSGESTVWCGRASASMMYNYFQLVNAHIGGEEEAAARKRFIKNNRDLNSRRPLDLIYPNDEIACHSGSTYFALAEPLIRIVKGWTRHPLLTETERKEYNADEGPQLEVAPDEIEEELQPVLDSLDRNTPVLAYTGLSVNDRAARHIVVISGYKREEDALWLHVTDPATMRDDDADDKGRLLEPVDAQGRPPRNLIEILDEGDWAVEESDAAAEAESGEVETTAATSEATNEAVKYWVTNDLDMTEEQRALMARRAWGVETYHRRLKQYCGVERSQCRSAQAQHNPIRMSIRAFLRLELHRVRSAISFYESKAAIIRDAIRAYLANPIHVLPSSA